MGISFWLRLYLIIAYFYLYIIHSTSILELSTKLFLKFNKYAFDIDALLSTTYELLKKALDDKNKIITEKEEIIRAKDEN